MSRQRIINISKDRLNNLYQKHSMREIAEIIGCGQTLIFNRIKEYKITLKGFEKGLSIPEVALISGHRDVRMLFRYTHLKAEDILKKL